MYFSCNSRSWYGKQKLNLKTNNGIVGVSAQMTSVLPVKMDQSQSGLSVNVNAHHQNVASPQLVCLAGGATAVIWLTVPLARAVPVMVFAPAHQTAAPLPVGVSDHGQVGVISDILK